MKKLLVILFGFLALHLQAQKQKNKFIYIVDPLCSWCYGFQLEIDKVLSHYGDSLELELLVGGMGIGNKKVIDQELRESLIDHWQAVHKHTGQIFDNRIVKSKKLIYNSEPICRAIVATKSLDSAKVLKMHKSLQTAFYAQNKNVTLYSEIQNVAFALGLDTVQFKKMYFSEENNKRTTEEFKRVEKNGVETFPILILSTPKEAILLTEGYATHKEIEKKLKKILKY